MALLWQWIYCARAYAFDCRLLSISAFYLAVESMLFLLHPVARLSLSETSMMPSMPPSHVLKPLTRPNCPALTMNTSTAYHTNTPSKQLIFSLISTHSCCLRFRCTYTSIWQIIEHLHSYLFVEITYATVYVQNKFIWSSISLCSFILFHIIPVVIALRSHL